MTKQQQNHRFRTDSSRNHNHVGDLRNEVKHVAGKKGVMTGHGMPIAGLMMNGSDKIRHTT